MHDLATGSCVPCRQGAPAATAAEIAEWLQELPDWRLVSSDGVPRLTRSYPFKNFQQALHFTNQVAAVAESEQHHPALLTEWGQVTVSWWTHKIRGLHRNDFIMAAKTEQLYRSSLA